MKCLLFALAVALAPAAEASPCKERLAALQSRFEARPHIAASAGTATETADAKLHHQPTAGTVATADASADSPQARRDAHFQVLMEQARAAEDSGDERECQASANEAEKALK